MASVNGSATLIASLERALVLAHQMDASPVKVPQAAVDGAQTLVRVLETITRSDPQAGIDRLFADGSPFPSLGMIDPEILPDYPGGPLGVRVFRGREVLPLPLERLPAPSEANVLMVNAGGDSRGYVAINYAAWNALCSGGKRVYAALNGPSSLTNPRPQIIELVPKLMTELPWEGELLFTTGSRNKGPFDTIPKLSGDPMAFFRSAVAPFLGGLFFTGGGGTANLVTRLVRDTEIKHALFAAATIDDDVLGLPEGTVGANATRALDTEAIRSLRRTASSCRTIHVVQIMGGHSGRLPAAAAKLAGEQAVIVPERGVANMRTIYEELFKTILQNRGAVLVIGETGSYQPLFSEEPVHFKPEKGLQTAATVGILVEIVRQEMQAIASRLYPNLTIDIRFTILGHTQRQPETHAIEDVRIGLDVGERAGKAILDRNFGVMIPTAPRTPVSLIETFGTFV